MSKSEQIREYLQRMPEAGPKELEERMKADGIEVTAGLISNVKSNLKKAAGESGDGS